MGNGKPKDYAAKRQMQNQNGQIIRKDGSGTFVEVIAPSDDFYQITMNLIQYDANYQQTAKISIYMDVPEFLAFCRRISNRELRIIIENDKKRCLAGDAKYYGEKADNKGVIPYSGMKLGPEMIKDANGLYNCQLMRGSKKNGTVTARQFWICSSSSKYADLVFTAVEGPGKEDDKGLIQLSGKPEKIIRVPMSHNAVEEIAEACIMRLYALETMYAIRGDFKRYKPDSYLDSENSVANPDMVNTATADNVPTSSYSEPAPESIPNINSIPDLSGLDAGLDFTGIEPGFVSEPVPEPQPQPVTNKPEIHPVTGKFTSDFQSLNNGAAVAEMDIKGRIYKIFFKAVPEQLKKAQEMGSEVTINIYYNNGNFAFDSLI